jgi:hypothetical protein
MSNQMASVTGVPDIAAACLRTPPLLAVHPLELQAGQLSGVLDLADGTLELLDAGRGDGDKAAKRICTKPSASSSSRRVTA